MTKKISLIVGSALVAALASTALASPNMPQPPAPAPATPMVNFTKCSASLDTAKLTFTAMEGMAGISMAVVSGDPKTGAYVAVHKWAAGTTTPVHTHSLESKVMVLAGTLTLKAGNHTFSMAKGSTFSTGGNEQHKTDCAAGADCYFCMEQTGAFDFKPVETAAKKP